MCVDRALVRLECNPAHRVQQLRAREHAAGLPRHRGEQLKFRLCQVDADAAEPRIHPRHIELDVGADSNHVGRGVEALGTAQHGAHSRDQLLRAERLGQVIVRAQLEPDQLVRLLGARGEHDDRHLTVASQGAGDVQPVEPREPEVEDDQVRPPSPRRTEGRRAV